MKYDREFFLRQHIKMSPSARPSNNPNKIRLRFLEKPYRYLVNLNNTKKAVLIGFILSLMIPKMIFTLSQKQIDKEYRRRAMAMVSDNYYEMESILNKTKHVKYNSNMNI